MRSDGGPGNTGRPNSVVLALHGNGPERFSRLRYQASFLHHARGRGDAHDERGYAVAIETDLELQGVSLTPFGEFVRIEHAAGLPGRSHYWTTGLTIARREWEASLSVALRERSEATLRDRLIDLSLARQLAGGLRMSIGARTAREAGVESLALSWKLEWTWQAEITGGHRGQDLGSDPEDLEPKSPLIRSVRHEPRKRDPSRTQLRV